MGNVLYHDCFLTVTSVMTSIHNAEGRLSQAEPCERSVLRPMGLVSWNLLNLFPQRFSNFFPCCTDETTPLFFKQILFVFSFASAS